jgi:hypothetical protein
MVAFESTSIKILGSTTVVLCEVLNCGVHAKFLFRTGCARISAYCEIHAAESARKLGITLPDPDEREGRRSWKGWIDPE